MDYTNDSRAHDSGYFTPSPDKENKMNENILPYHTMIENINCSMNATNANTKLIEPKVTNNSNGNSDCDRPPLSYIALISMAILHKSDHKILLNEIYDWVVQRYPYYQSRTDKSWRNSIRHNLSLNECFIKVGKAGNGRGFYWSIHPANIEDFKKGDFRRRQARLRAKHNKCEPTTHSNGMRNIMRTPTTTSSSIMNTSPTSLNHSMSHLSNDSLNRSIASSNSHHMSAASSHNLSQHYLESNHQHLGSNQLPNSSLCNTSPHYQLVNNESNYSSGMNINCLSSPVPVTHHNIQSSNVYHHSHHATPTHQQGSHHHQYNYMPLPWITSAAAAAAAQLSTNSFLESLSPSALACGYNSILPHSYSTSNEMANDNSPYHHSMHNFHKYDNK